MEVFRNLYVSADASRMADAVERMEKTLPDGWTRDNAAEARARNNPVLTPRIIYCFACTEEGRRPAAIIILAQKDPGTFYASNIIPIKRYQLAHVEYNSVLEDFYQRVLRPVAEQAGLSHILTSADMGLDHWMSDKTAEKLRHFSASANKSTGSSHPSDLERWNDFVLSAHKEQSKLDPSTLKRWLTESEDWPPDVAEQLAIEYEYGRELLAYAEGARWSA